MPQSLLPTHPPPPTRPAVPLSRPCPAPPRPPLQPKDMGLPVHAYTARDEVREDGTQRSQRVFVNLPTEVGATEAEEIGECKRECAGG